MILKPPLGVMFTKTNLRYIVRHQSTKRKNFVIWSQGHRPTSRGSTRRSCCCRGAPRHDRVPRCSALRLCRSCTPRARRPGTNRFDRQPTGHSGAPSAPNELRQHRHHILGTSSSCEACWANGLCSSYKPFPRAREATRARDSSLPVSRPCSQIVGEARTGLLDREIDESNRK